MGIRMASFRATPCNDLEDREIEHVSNKLKSRDLTPSRSHQIRWTGKRARQTCDNIQSIIQIEAESFIVRA